MKHIIRGILPVIISSVTAASAAPSPQKFHSLATQKVSDTFAATTTPVPLADKDVSDDIIKLIPTNGKKASRAQREATADEILSVLNKPSSKKSKASKKSGAAQATARTTVTNTTSATAARKANTTSKTAAKKAVPDADTQTAQSTATPPVFAGTRHAYSSTPVSIPTPLTVTTGASKATTAKSTSSKTATSKTTSGKSKSEIVVKKVDPYPNPQSLSYEKAKELADKLYAENKLISAIRFLDRVLSLKEDCQTLYKRAKTLSKLHQYSLAITDYSKVLSTCKVNGNTILLEKAEILASAGRAQEALAIVDSEMSRTSQFDSALIDEKVGIYRIADLKEDAIRYLSGLIQQRPSEPHYYSLRSGAYLDNYDFNNALNDANRQIELANNTDGLLTRARVEQQFYQFNECAADCNKVIQYSPREKDAYELLGKAEFELKHYDKAKEAAEGVLRLDPNNWGALKLLGRIALEQENYALALDLLSRANEAMPSDSGTYICLYNSFTGSNQQAAAKSIVDTASKYSDQDANYWLLRAVLANDSKEYAEAVKFSDNALAKDPYFTAAGYFRSAAHYNEEKFSEALADAESALQRNPKPMLIPDLIEFKSRSLFKLNRKDEAYATLSNAINANPQSEKLREVKMSLLRKDRKYPEALAEAKLLLSYAENKANCYDNIGALYALQGKFDESIEAYKHAAELKPKDSWYCRQLAVVYSLKKDNGNALIWADKSIALDPKAEGTTGFRAEIQLGAGRAQQALIDLNKAIASGDKDEELYTLRADANFLMHNWDAGMADALAYDKKVHTFHSADEVAMNLCGLEKYSEVLPWAQKAASFDDNSDEQKMEVPIIIALCHLNLKNTNAANEVLAKISRTNQWPYPVVDYIKGQLPLQQLDSVSSSDEDHRTDFHCYVGLKALADGDTTLARTHFEWVAKNGNHRNTLAPIALTWLARHGAGH